MLAYEQLCLAVSRCEKFSDFFVFFYESFLIVFLQLRRLQTSGKSSFMLAKLPFVYYICIMHGNTCAG